MRSVSIRQLDMKQATIPLGFEGENEFTEVRIDCKKTFDQHPDAVPSMTVTDPAGNKYPAVVTRDGDIVVWQLTAGDLTTKGYGEIQIEFIIDGTVIGKTDIARTRIERSIFPEGEAPDPVQNWLDEANQTLAEVEEAKQAFPAGGTTGQVLTKKSDEDYDAEWETPQGGGGGTSNYNDLDNKPSINGVTLTGNKSLSDLSIPSQGDVNAKYTKPQGGIPASDIDPSAIPSPTSIIDDNAGEGDTNKVLSADKVIEITAGLSEAIENIQEDIPGYVDDWLDDHPEATTTVQDGSITKAKLASDVANMLDTAETNDVSILGKIGVSSIRNKQITGSANYNDLLKFNLKNGVQYTEVIKLKAATTKAVYYSLLQSDGTVIGYSNNIAVGSTYAIKVVTMSADYQGARFAVKCAADCEIEYAALIATDSLIEQIGQTMTGDEITILSTTSTSGKTLSSVGVVTDSADATYFVTDEVEVKENSWYMVTGSAGYGSSYYAIYDADHNVITTLRSPNTSGTSIVNKLIYTPERAKYIRIAFASTVSDGLIASCTTLKAKNKRTPEWFGKFLNISYSDIGVSCINTVETYLSAGKFGFNVCKGDVRPTSDGKLIMCHDAGFTFDVNGRITTYNGSNNTLIRSLTHAQCMEKEYAARAGSAENNHYQKVADIDQFLDVCKQYDMIAFITVRDEYISDVCTELMAALHRHNMTERAIVNSYNATALARVRMMDDNIPLSFVQSNDLTLTEAIVNRIASYGKCAITLVTANDMQTYISGLSSAINYANQKGVGVMFAQPHTMGDVFYIRSHGICGAQIGRTILPYQFNPVKFKIKIENSTPSLAEWNNLSTMDVTVSASGNVISASAFTIAGSDRGFPDLILDVWMNKFPYRITAVSEGGHTVSAKWQSNALKLTVDDISVNDTIDVIIEV